MQVNQKGRLEAFGMRLKKKVIQILEKLKSKEAKVQDLEIVYNAPGVQQGKNFIGYVKDNQVIGKAIYFQSSQQEVFDIYIGQLVEGKPFKKGLRIQYPQIQRKQQGKSYSIDFSRYTAIMLEDWAEEVETSGYLIDKEDEIDNDGNLIAKEKHFKGLFNKDKTMKEGRLEQYQKSALISRYEGKFKNNQFDGPGKLQKIGKYRFEGQFKTNRKQGLGVETDFQRKAIYIGNFEVNEKNGYGEVTFQRSKIVRLKGFWKNGSMVDGVFTDQKGEALQKFDRSFTRVI